MTFCKRTFCVQNSETEITELVLGGRLRWTLESLLSAREKGCTPIDNLAPRWSGYVHDLRNLGVNIETITEPHGGDFAGTHARYVLRSKIKAGAAE